MRTLRLQGPILLYKMYGRKRKEEQKMKKFFENWLQGIKSRWQFLLIACGVWTLLAYCWQVGKTNAIYMGLYYLSVITYCKWVCYSDSYA